MLAIFHEPDQGHVCICDLTPLPSLHTSWHFGLQVFGNDQEFRPAQLQTHSSCGIHDDQERWARVRSSDPDDCGDAAEYLCNAQSHRCAQPACGVRQTRLLHNDQVRADVILDLPDCSDLNYCSRPHL